MRRSTLFEESIEAATAHVSSRQDAHPADENRCLQPTF
jgi:hypothetical protein